MCKESPALRLFLRKNGMDAEPSKVMPYRGIPKIYLRILYHIRTPFAMVF